MIFKVRNQCSFQVFSFFESTLQWIVQGRLRQFSQDLFINGPIPWEEDGARNIVHYLRNEGYIGFSRDAALARSSLIFVSLSFLFTCYASIVFIAFQFFSDLFIRSRKLVR